MRYNDFPYVNTQYLEYDPNTIDPRDRRYIPNISIEPGMDEYLAELTSVVIHFALDRALKANPISIALFNLISINSFKNPFFYETMQFAYDFMITELDQAPDAPIPAVIQFVGDRTVSYMAANYYNQSIQIMDDCGLSPDARSRVNEAFNEYQQTVNQVRRHLDSIRYTTQPRGHYQAPSYQAPSYSYRPPQRHHAGLGSNPYIPGQPPRTGRPAGRTGHVPIGGYTNQYTRPTAPQAPGSYQGHRTQQPLGRTGHVPTVNRRTTPTTPEPYSTPVPSFTGATGMSQSSHVPQVTHPPINKDNIMHNQYQPTQHNEEELLTTHFEPVQDTEIPVMSDRDEVIAKYGKLYKLDKLDFIGLGEDGEIILQDGSYLIPYTGKLKVTRTPEQPHLPGWNSILHTPMYRITPDNKVFLEIIENILDMDIERHKTRALLEKERSGKLAELIKEGLEEVESEYKGMTSREIIKVITGQVVIDDPTMHDSIAMAEVSNELLSKRVQVEDSVDKPGIIATTTHVVDIVTDQEQSVIEIIDSLRNADSPVTLARAIKASLDSSFESKEDATSAEVLNTRLTHFTNRYLVEELAIPLHISDFSSDFEDLVKLVANKYGELSAKALLENKSIMKQALGVASSVRGLSKAQSATYKSAEYTTAVKLGTITSDMEFGEDEDPFELAGNLLAKENIFVIPQPTIIAKANFHSSVISLFTSAQDVSVVVDPELMPAVYSIATALREKVGSFSGQSVVIKTTDQVRFKLTESPLVKGTFLIRSI